MINIPKQRLMETLFHLSTTVALPPSLPPTIPVLHLPRPLFLTLLIFPCSRITFVEKERMKREILPSEFH